MNTSKNRLLAIIGGEAKDGTVTLLLKELAAAERDADQVLGVVRNREPEFAKDIETAFDRFLHESSAAKIGPMAEQWDIPWKIVRFEASTQDELMEMLEDASVSAETCFEQASTFGKSFDPDLSCRAAFVVSTPEELRTKLSLAGKIGRTAPKETLSQKGIFLTTELFPGKIAFLFPGHGSEYSGMLRSLVESFPPARKTLTEFNRDLAELGYPCFEQLVWQEGGPLDLDPFRIAELALVTADAVVFESLRALGISPDVISSHSFGEYAALYGAGCWSYPELARAAWASSDAHLGCHTARGGMVCTNLNKDEAHRICHEIGGEIYISNINAPDQIVLAGRKEEIAKAERRINADGGMAKCVPVTNAIHTVLMHDVCKPLFDGVSEIGMKTPSVDFLCSVTNDYLSDVDEILYNLGEQVVRPVRYVEQVERLARDGVTAMVECGPGRVLSRLHRRILGDDAPMAVIASDNKHENGLFSLLCVKACLETHGSGEGTKNIRNTVSAAPVVEDGLCGRMKSWGKQHRARLIEAVRKLADAGGVSSERLAVARNWSPEESAAIDAAADGAGLLSVTLRALFTEPEERRHLLEAIALCSETVESESRHFPLVHTVSVQNGSFAGECLLRPAEDPFLLDHRFRGRPLLPAVITLELFAETVRQLFPGKKIAAIRDVELLHGCGFRNDDPTTLHILTKTRNDRTDCRLVGPFYNSRGVLLEPERVYATGSVETSLSPVRIHENFSDDSIEPVEETRHRIKYLDEKSMMYHGPVFQQAVEAFFTPDGNARGHLIAAPLDVLAGRRGSEGWILSPATVDAGLYLAGICVWVRTGGALGLPKKIESLRIGRLPSPDESCTVDLRLRSEDDRESRFDILCRGEDGEILYSIDGYCCQVVPTSVKKAVPAT